MTGAVTRVGLAPRAAGLGFAAALEYWRTAHRDVALEIPGLRGYVQNHAVLRDGRPLLPYPGFDVCAETEFDDIASMRAGFASDHYRQTVRADESHLIDGSRFMLALTRRHLVADGTAPPGAVKLITFLRAHPGVDPPKLAELLAGPYAEAASEAAPLRHELLVTEPGWHAGELPACADAVDMLWFADAPAALAALRGPLAERAGWLLARHAFGSERVIAAPVRQR